MQNGVVLNEVWYDKRRTHCCADLSDLEGPRHFERTIMVLLEHVWAKLVPLLLLSVSVKHSR